MKAIVYTSQTGRTKRYAQMLGEKLGLPVYSLTQAKLPKGTEILYLGWLFAARIKGYRKAMRRYTVKVVCGVGLCETGCLLSEVRNANRIPAQIPLFTLQGGMARSQLRGVNKIMIDGLANHMQSKTDPTEDDRRMAELMAGDTDFVSEENLAAVLAWVAENQP